MSFLFFALYFLLLYVFYLLLSILFIYFKHVWNYFWSIFITPYLKTLSDNFNISYVSVGIYWLSFFHWFVMFLVLGMMSEYLLKPRAVCRVMRLWILLKPSIVAGFLWCLCGRGKGATLLLAGVVQVDAQVPTQPYLTSNCWLLFIAGLGVGICFAKWSPLIQWGLLPADNKKVQAPYLAFPDTTWVVQGCSQTPQSASAGLSSGRTTVFLWCSAAIKHYCLNVFFLLSFSFPSALIGENRLLLKVFLLLLEFGLLNSSAPWFGWWGKRKPKELTPVSLPQSWGPRQSFFSPLSRIFLCLIYT